MCLTFARFISVLGHPLLLMPLAALVLLMLGGHRTDAGLVGVGFVVFAAALMGWSIWQVRSGRWAHVDASSHHERSQLNRRLLPALLLAAGASALALRQPSLTLALVLSAAIVAIAMLGTRWLKLSLHVSFAVFAALLLSRWSVWASVAGLGFALALSWSRLYLQRHVPRDVIGGAVAGAVAGLAFLLLNGHFFH